jgi:hypothetical protein
MDLRSRITEDEFTDQVLAFAKLHGWLRAHFRPAMTSRGWRTAVQGDGVGWPDLVLVRGGVMIAAELKVGDNKPTADQEKWLAAFRECGATAFVWTPGDWAEIERVLGAT